MTNHKVASRAVGALLAALALVAVTALPAHANSITWNYTAPNCTGTTIHGQNNWNGLQFSGYTSRTQDICFPGTTNYTRVVLWIGTTSGWWQTTGTHSGTGVMTGSGSRLSSHTYATSSRQITG